MRIDEPRFPTVPREAGHYESYFVKGHHPTEPCAFWLRHTVHQRPGERQTASLWLTLFDDEGVLAGKQTFADPVVPSGAYIGIGPAAVLGPTGGHGVLESHTLDTRWNFTFAGDDPPQAHLPAAWMYDAAVPRTKSGTPHPGVTFAGRVGPFRVDGWRGLVSHNWGSQHAERWIWLHAALDDGWLEMVLGRVRLGGWTTPWLANGALQLGGRRYRLGGIDRARATKVDETPTGARFVVRGEHGVRLEAAITAPASRFVCWRYADPEGPEHHSAHSSLADLHGEVRLPGRPPIVLDVPSGASYELGMLETDHGLTVQPYDDGRL